jgi:anti-sigma B factor antagonist
MSDAERPGFQVESKNGVLIVRLDGPKLPPESAEPLYRLANEAAQPKVVLDFRQISFLSSNGVAILAILKKRLDASGGGMALFGVEPDIEDVLRLTAMDRVLRIFPSEPAALGAL